MNFLDDISVHRKRKQRQNIRNAYIVASIKDLEAAKKNQDAFGQECLDEMIEECHRCNVINFGDTPAW